MADKCKECGCICGQCMKNDENHADMHLHVEIEHLRQRLLERDSHIVTMETQFLNEADKFPNGELASMKEEMLTWQEKYSRLYEAHKRVQKVNQNLEDKLLRIVDKCETEKSAFTKDIATLSHRLADANYTIHRLTQDNEKYRNDVNLAIQLLQCKPSNFVSQRYDSLPSEVQAKVRTYVSQKRGGGTTPCGDGVAPPDVKSITVPISTFPPTAMVYNITKPNNVDKDSDDESDDSKPPVDIVSAAIMAKVLEERERERVFAKHCDTCTCHRSILTNDVQTQTDHFLNNVADTFNDSNYSNGKTNVEINADRDLNANNGSVSSTSSLQYVNEKSFTVNNSLVKNKDNAKSNNKNDRYSLTCDTKKGVSQSPMKQATFNQMIDKTSTRQITGSRNSKKSESPSAYRLSKTASQSTKYKPLPSSDIDLIDLKPQRQIDVINERIWKNQKSATTKPVETKTPIKQTGEQTIDVINERAWKSVENNCQKPRLTLIEVKPLLVESVLSSNTQQSDSRFQQSEDTASPSFSSDSLVISSSDPPSTSSDAISQLGVNNRVNISNGKTLINNNLNNSLMSNWQDRTTGPRGCSMRITPGSKNILLDNAGNYQTVLYTSSGGGRPNTALVHTPKSTKSVGSTSTNSSNEDNPRPVLPTDNSQLQRVAEWIKASGPIERQSSNCGTIKSNDDMSIKKLNNALSKIKDGIIMEKKSNVNNSNGGNLNDVIDKMERAVIKDNSKIDIHADLISFESPVHDNDDDDDNDDRIDFTKDSNVGQKVIDVKVTREMEETYLKLAASLDPSNLQLTSSQSADITIEKYRKEYKRNNFIKNQDKNSAPGATS